jgi:beta-N-acetylhexosaminidase
MRVVRRLVALIVVGGLASGVGTPLAMSAPTATANLVCAESVVANWTPTQLANETIVVSVEVANIGSMAPAARAGYGGLLLFGTLAPTSLAAVLARLQASTPLHYAMMVMTDEEGGGVQRLTNVIGSIPWAQTMAKTLTSGQIAAIGRRTGAALLRVGVNVDLAPVLDVDARAVPPGAANPDGLRSFGGSASVVAADGTAFMTGLAQANVTSVVKHFPGLGGATQNTDVGPARTLAWSVLKASGLVPFERAIAAGATAVMLSNASVPGLTSLPASLSPVVIRVLRQSLGFTGLIVTDALSAGAISSLGLSLASASVAAITAGADQVLNGRPTSSTASLAQAGQVSSALVTAVNSGSLPIATLRAAAAQVLATRNVVACPTGPSA